MRLILFSILGYRYFFHSPLWLRPYRREALIPGSPNSCVYNRYIDKAHQLIYCALRMGIHYSYEARKFLLPLFCLAADLAFSPASTMVMLFTLQ